MTTEVFLAVLVAALLHASWNALVKVSTDRLVLLAVLKIGTTVFAVASIPFITVPPAEAWPYIIASTVIHTGYFLFLVQSYRFGDLSHVYPIQRGVAPLLVAGVSAIFLGEVLGIQATIALLLIAAGIMSLVLTTGQDGWRSPKAVSAALATACFTAGYTVVDGTGARLTGAAHDYVLWLNVVNGIPILLIAMALRWGTIRQQVGTVWRAGMLSGIVSLFSYWIVLWAATQAPLALVAAVRETSMIFAILIGAVFLKERIDLRRLASVFVTMTGAALLKLAR